MEAINFITRFINWLPPVIGAGAGAMVGYFALRKSIATDFEEMGHYTIRIKQTIKGAIVAISISGFITLVKTFFT